MNIWQNNRWVGTLEKEPKILLEIKIWIIWINSVDNINTCLNTAEKRTDEVKVTSVNHPKYSTERQRKRKKYEWNIKSYGEQSEKHWHGLAIISGDNRENAG